MTKISVISKDFLQSRKGEYWLKDQVIFKYKEPVDKSLVIDQVKYLTLGMIENVAAMIFPLDSKHFTYMVTVPDSHKWADKKMYNVRPAPRVPVPHAPVFPDMMKNNLMVSFNSIQNKFHTSADEFMHS